MKTLGHVTLIGANTVQLYTASEYFPTVMFDHELELKI